MSVKQPSEPVASVLSRLKRVRKTGAGWVASCPCRDDDSNPSLSVSEGDDGRVLMNCHLGAAGCSVPQICSSMGLTMDDLFPKKDKPVEPKLTLTNTYNYFDAFGELLFQKLRYVDQDGKKTFRQRRPDGDGWSYSLGDLPKVLYNLPAVAEAVENGVTVWLVEGEKDADTMTAAGFVATTMPGGAGKWLDLHTDTLAEATVNIVADNDEPGVKHAVMVAEKLQAAGCKVTVLRTPRGKDVSEFFGMDGTVEGLVPLDDSASDVREEDDKFSRLADEVVAILSREDLSEVQRLAKASILLSKASSPDVVPQGKLVDWQDFINEDVDDSYDWIIPGVIERQERVIVVAAEGVGKTMLARQIAICSAAGIHPFKFSHMKPITTLTIDLENPERIIRRTSRKIMEEAVKRRHVDRVRAHLVIQPSGVDLLKMSDRSFIEEQIEKVEPDLICIGPLYKSFVDPGGRTSEAVAIEVAKYLDTIRDVYGCALWMEHHAPLGNSLTSRELRPFGSAVWSRWPEFGLALQPDPMAGAGYHYDVKHFRGERDVREFPTKMTRGSVFPFEVTEFRKVQ